jgi:hypothetical protein
MNDEARPRDAMTFRELVAWAWEETPPVHKNRMNLMIHLVAVPLFVVGHVAAVIGVVLMAGSAVVPGLGAIVLSLILQKRGHALERIQVHAFSSPRDFIRRLYAEQLCNFWRFLFSGQWYASYQRAKPSA